MEQLIVVLAKADAVVSELDHDWDTEAHEALIASREKQVVNLLLRMRFQRSVPFARLPSALTTRSHIRTRTHTPRRQNIHVVVTSAWKDKGFVSPFFAKGLSMADALENIRYGVINLHCTLHCGGDGLK